MSWNFDFSLLLKIEAIGLQYTIIGLASLWDQQTDRYIQFWAIKKQVSWHKWVFSITEWDGSLFRKYGTQGCICFYKNNSLIEPLRITVISEVPTGFPLFTLSLYSILLICVHSIQSNNSSFQICQVSVSRSDPTQYENIR